MHCISGLANTSGPTLMQSSAPPITGQTDQNFDRQLKEGDRRMNIFLGVNPLRGGVKYYFADFVRNGGTPPLRTKFLQKKSYGFGGYPPPPLYGLFPQKNS